VSVPSGCRKLALGRFVKFGDSGALALSRILGDPYDNVTGIELSSSLLACPRPSL